MGETASTPPLAEHKEEIALLVKLRAPDKNAFEELVRIFDGRMLAVARRFLNNDEDARDAVQDAFLAAFKAIDQFEGHCRVSTWLHRIVLNVSLAKLRSRQHKNERSIDDLLPRYLRDGHQDMAIRCGIERHGSPSCSGWIVW